MERASAGCRLGITAGLDLGGTSKEVLEELLSWECDTFIFHNPNPRATFHPKVYLFEGADAATLFVGSNNLTDGGFYTNYEAAVRYDFELPSDSADFQRNLDPLLEFLNPSGGQVMRLSRDLVETLHARGELSTEDEAREQRHRRRAGRNTGRVKAPNPFVPVPVPLPPLLPPKFRSGLPRRSGSDSAAVPRRRVKSVRPTGWLVWKKVLPASDALRVKEGTHPVGGVRLVQARFPGADGKRINQTTYFRNIFDGFRWEPEGGKHPDQEHAFVPMRVFVGSKDCGIWNFEISHKPSGEAGQANYTTILRWGKKFADSIVRKANLTGREFSLYETPDAEAPFLMEIS